MSDHAGSIQTESLEELFAAQQGPLLRYTYKLVQNPDVSQDIVQEAFMKLHAQFGQIRQPRHWLYRTTHNLALNHLRAGRKIVPLDFDDQPQNDEAGPAIEPAPDQHLQRAEAVEKTRHCLATLDERGRQLIRLKFEEGLSYREISDQTGLSIGNVGYILHHTLKRLAAELEVMGVTL